jgi:hypothetical protein
MIYTEVKLDKARNILLGFHALREFKRITGKSLAKIDFEEADMEDFVPVVFFCGLKHEDKELTLDSTIELIDKHIGIKGAIGLLPKVLEDAFGKDDGIKNVARAATSKTKRKTTKKIV